MRTITANNKGADQPVHQGSLINAFVVRLLGCVVRLLGCVIDYLVTYSIYIFQLVLVAKQAGSSLTGFRAKTCLRGLRLIQAQTRYTRLTGILKLFL